MIWLLSAAVAETLLLPPAVIAPQEVRYVAQEDCQPPSAFRLFTPTDARIVTYESEMGRHEVVVSCAQNTPLRIFLYPADDPEHRYMVSLMEFGILLDRRSGSTWERICDNPSCGANVEEDFRRQWRAAYEDAQALYDATTPFVAQYTIPEDFTPVPRAFPPLPADAPPIILQTRTELVKVSPHGDAPVTVMAYTPPSRTSASLGGAFSSQPLTSPDGTMLALPQGSVLLLLLTDGSTNGMRLNLPGDVLIHSWSPDGAHLLLSANRQYSLVNAERGEGAPLPEAAGSLTPVAWTSADTLLMRTRAWQMSSVNISTGEVQPLWQAPDGTRQAWWRDGVWIVHREGQVSRGDTRWFDAPENTRRMLPPSPDGNAMLIHAGSELWVVQEGSDTPTSLTEFSYSTSVAWYDNEHLILWASYPAPMRIVKLDGSIYNLPNEGVLVRRSHH